MNSLTNGFGPARRTAAALAGLALILPATTAHAAVPAVTSTMSGMLAGDLVTSMVVGPDNRVWGVYTPDDAASSPAVVVHGLAEADSASGKTLGPAPAVTGAATSVGFDGTGAIYIGSCEDLVVGTKTSWVGQNAINVFSAGFTHTSKAARTIAGSKTGLGVGTDCLQSGSLAVGWDGTAYVLGTDGVVRVFAAGAKGNVAPVRTLGGSATGITANSTLKVAADGTLYVGSAGSLRVFAAGAKGNAAPVRTLAGSATGVSDWTTFGVDNFGDVYAQTKTTLAVFAPGAKGNVAPVLQRRLVTSADDPVGGSSVDVIAKGQLVGVGRDRSVLGAYRIQGVGEVWAGFPAVVAKHAATVTIGSLSAPSTKATGSAKATVKASGTGGWLSGTVRFMLSAKGQKSVTVTTSLAGHNEPTATAVTAALPELARGSWTLTVGYGGNGDFSAASTTKTFTVK